MGVPRTVAIVFLAIFTVATFAYSWAWPQAPAATGDSGLYINLAEYLGDRATGKPLGNVDLLKLVEERTPGYATMLALAGVRRDTPRRAFYLNLAMHFAAVWLMASTLALVGFGTPVLISFGVLSCLPFYMESTAWMLTETATEFTLALGFSGLVHWMVGRSWIWLALSAVAFAFSGLVRITYQMLGLTLAACFLLAPWIIHTFRIRGKSFHIPAAALALASFLLLGSYAAFYYSQTGYFGISYSMGLNMTTKTVGFIERLPDQDAQVREFLLQNADRARSRRGSSHTGTMYIWGPTFREFCALTGLGPVDASKLLLKLNLKLIARSPLEYLQTVGAAAVSYWFPYTTHANLGSRVLQGVWLLFNFAVVGLFFAQLAVISVWGGAEWLKMFARRRQGEVARLSGQTALGVTAYGMCLVIIFYTLAISCLFDTGNPRYRVPTDQFILAACFAGTQATWRKLKSLFSGRHAAALGEGILAPESARVTRDEATVGQ